MPYTSLIQHAKTRKHQQKYCGAEAIEFGVRKKEGQEFKVVFYRI